MNPHFILDYETLGQDVFTVPVVNCAYYIFDWDRFISNNPYTFNELVQDIRLDKFNVEEQVKEGYKFSKRDLEWWAEQGDEAKKQIKPSADDIPVKEFVYKLYDYLREAKLKRWWSRSNTFDPILLSRNFKDYYTREAMDFILPYWLVRDTRTYFDTRYDFKLKKNAFCPIDDQALWDKYFILHNPVHDLAADILRLQRVERVIHINE